MSSTTMTDHTTSATRVACGAPALVSVTVVRFDLRKHAIQRGPAGQQPGQHGIAAAGLSLQGGERGA